MTSWYSADKRRQLGYRGDQSNITYSVLMTDIHGWLKPGETLRLA